MLEERGGTGERYNNNSNNSNTDPELKKTWAKLLITKQHCIVVGGCSIFYLS
jgi:hypothetical protein